MALMKNIRRKQFGIFSALFAILLLIAFLAVTLMLVSIQLLIRSYKEFTYEKPVAVVIVKPAGNQKAKLTLVQSEGKDSTLVKKEFNISGDQWIIEGDILKWKPYLNFLGLHSRYRLTRIEGRYLRIRDEKSKKRSLYALNEESQDNIWTLLYRVAYKLPLVNTVYVSAAYQFSDRENIFLVYVTDSGFLIRRKKE